MVTGTRRQPRGRAVARARRAVAVAAVGFVLAGCGGGGEPAGQDGAAAAGLGRGELLATACRACHTLERGAEHSIGPNLHGVFGRRAGSLEDFEYSPALATSDIVWTPERLEAWLARPDDFVPGTTMTFTGYQDAADRRALIAYLEKVTAHDRAGPAP